MRFVRIPPSPAASGAPTSSVRAAPTALNREGADLPASSAPGMPVDTGPTETVIRPTGLRHGRFEAHEWVFWTMGAAIVLAAIAYGLVRIGVLNLDRYRKKT